jgi:hypothetical protein
MFGLFSSVLRKRRERRWQNERLLLVYWDGQRERRIDPYRAYRQLQAHPEIDLEAIAPLVDQGQEPETTQLVNALADVFGVCRYDDATGRGLTDWEIIDLLAALNEFLLALKKKSNLGPTPHSVSA